MNNEQYNKWAMELSNQEYKGKLLDLLREIRKNYA